jgi:hypothetical protein
MKPEQEALAPPVHLFTVRVWREELGEGQHEWRGLVRSVASGEARYFRTWPALTDFMLEMLGAFEDEQHERDR